MISRRLPFAVGLLAFAACTGAPDWQPAQAPLMTRWARQVSPTNARPEYPRPQMTRSEWMNLNGLWDYAVTPRDSTPQGWHGSILVPYAIESALSGVGDTVGPSKTLWYRRMFRVPPRWAGRRVLLHFEASDWETRVWVNGHEVGTHRGGYDPFTFDITPHLGGRGGQELRVAVWDPTDSGPQARGKQVRRPRGIVYTSVTGLWQTVWVEPVGETALEDYAVTTDIDSGTVTLTPTVTGARAGDRIEATLRPAADTSARGARAEPLVTLAGPADGPLTLRVPAPHLWSTDDPYLYDLDLRVLRGEEVLDSVRGYVGMRRIAVGPDSLGRTRLLLNGRTVFQNGPLDQGYWPDGLYTAPTEEAMVSDLRVLKAMGFNMLRKHVKVEPRTFYTWCDRLGMLVWQDMPSSGSMPLVNDSSDRATDTVATRQFETELERMVRTHRNHPSIVMWVPFNEGWGQYDTPRIAQLVRNADPTRLVNAASGWYDRRVGDVVDRHDYPAPVPPRPEARRAAVQGEFGGLGLVVRHHVWREGGWGYDLFGNEESLTQRFEDVYGIIRAGEAAGLSAAVYTQTTDVETENNGLLTYDRAVTKIPAMSVRLALMGYAAPRAERGPAIFLDSTMVTFRVARPGAVVRYTTDGTAPRRSAPEYTGPFAVRETATVMARAWWPDGTWSRVSSFGLARVTPREPLEVASPVPGLTVDYFEADTNWRHLPAFDSLVPVRTTTTSSISLDHAPRREQFGLRFRGFVRIPVTGVYGFRVASDDGTRLWVDGSRVIDNDGVHGMREQVGWVALAAGMHAIRLDFFQGCCGVGLTFEVETPGRARGPLPPTWLFHEPPGARGTGGGAAQSISLAPSVVAWRERS